MHNSCQIIHNHVCKRHHLAYSAAHNHEKSPWKISVPLFQDFWENAKKVNNNNRQRRWMRFVNKESRWRQTLLDMVQAVRLQPVIESGRDRGLTAASEFIFHLDLTEYYYFYELFGDVPGIIISSTDVSHCTKIIHTIRVVSIRAYTKNTWKCVYELSRPIVVEISTKTSAGHQVPSSSIRCPSPFQSFMWNFRLIPWRLFDKRWKKCKKCIDIPIMLTNPSWYF